MKIFVLFPLRAIDLKKKIFVGYLPIPSNLDFAWRSKFKTRANKYLFESSPPSPSLYTRNQMKTFFQLISLFCLWPIKSMIKHQKNLQLFKLLIMFQWIFLHISPDKLKQKYLQFSSKIHKIFCKKKPFLQEIKMISDWKES